MTDEQFFELMFVLKEINDKLNNISGAYSYLGYVVTKEEI